MTQKKDDSMISLVMLHLMVEPAVQVQADSIFPAWILVICLVIFLVTSSAAVPEEVRTNGPMKGANLRTSVRITFEEAVFGCEKEIDMVLKDECTTCGGTGAKPGTTPETCTKCGGKGKVVFTQQSLFGMVQNVQTCPECNGSGKIIKDRCTACRGTGYTSSRKKIKVSIPAGIDNGQSVRIREKGEPGVNGGPRGDLLVEVIVSSTSDLPASGYEYLFYCTDFFCSGSVRRRNKNQHRRW